MKKKLPGILTALIFIRTVPTILVAITPPAYRDHVSVRTVKYISSDVVTSYVKVTKIF